MNQLTFFNTVNLQGEVLARARKECADQDVRVLEVFLVNHTRNFTPWEVCEQVDGILFTSVRRSITTLTAKGYLEKTEEQRAERYGKPNYCWRAANP